MFELFHAISDASSARVRKYVVDHELGETIRFRNVHYEEVKTALKERGGTNAPALWDGEKLTKSYLEWRTRLEKWHARAKRLHLRVAARESF